MTVPSSPRRWSWPQGAALLLAAAALATGCGGGKIPPSHYYRLAVSEPAAPPAPPEGIGRLEVGIPAFDVDPPYDQERIVRRGGRDSLEVGFHSDHRWAAPLSRMLPVVVGDHLMEVAGGFVSAGPPAGRPLDARLEGRLMALEEIGTPEGPVAHVRMGLTLRARDGEAVWTQVVEGERAVDGMEASAVPRAMQEAIVEALDSSRGALTGTLLGMARSRERTQDQP